MIYPIIVQLSYINMIILVQQLGIQTNIDNVIYENG